MKNRKWKPRYKVGEIVTTDLDLTPRKIKSAPSWDGNTWLYVLEGERKLHGESLLCVYFPPVTEGEWIVSTKGQFVNRRDVDQSNEKIFVVEHYTEDRRDEIDSLISQAPAMYRALKEALEYRKQTHHGSDLLINKIESILQKANPKQ